MQAAPSQGALLPEGRSSFSQPMRGLSGLPVAPGGGPSLVRPSRNASAKSLRASVQAEEEVGVQPGWELLPAVIPPGAEQLVQLPSTALRYHQERGAVLDLPAGASAVPLHLAAGLPAHTMCVRCVSDAVGASEGLALWSRPVTFAYPDEAVLHVVAPVDTGGAGEGEGDAAHLTAAAQGRHGGVAILRIAVQVWPQRRLL